MKDPTFGIDWTVLPFEAPQDGRATIRPDGGVAVSPRSDLGLFMGPTIGEGGMGIVRHGTQGSLGRAVAVKTLKQGSAPRRGPNACSRRPE